MAMTEAVKDELGRLSVTRPCCRKAEVSALPVELEKAVDIL